MDRFSFDSLFLKLLLHLYVTGGLYGGGNLLNNKSGFKSNSAWEGVNWANVDTYLLPFCFVENISCVQF